MRVISGEAGGIRLKVPGTVSRPTSDRVRESLFSILGERVCDARVLDLYAGSGALGIEALSRGAREGVFVESNRGAAAVIEENLERTSLKSRAKVECRRVESYLGSEKRSGRLEAYELIFADPPYRKDAKDDDILGGILTGGDLAAIAAPGALLVFERRKGTGSLSSGETWQEVDARIYGDTEIVILKRKEEGKE